MKLLSSGYVVNGDHYYSPWISLSPFSALSQRSFGSVNDQGLRIIEGLFVDSHWIFVESGRSAIELAIHDLRLTNSDEVWIRTSSGNSYVSRCVTDTISRFCGWSMSQSSKTKAVYIIHEFGRDSRVLLDNVAELGLPVIEDAAYGLLTAMSARWKFDRADYTIFSFPKAFEMQFGGVLVSPRRLIKGLDSELVEAAARAATNWITSYVEISRIRRSNFQTLNQTLGPLGCGARFELGDNEVPGAFICNIDSNTNLPQLKDFLNLHGCESTIFYGEQACILPVHQNIGVDQIEYIGDLLHFFLNQSGSR